MNGLLNSRIVKVLRVVVFTLCGLAALYFLSLLFFLDKFPNF
jgi:hypothetical protein